MKAATWIAAGAAVLIGAAISPSEAAANPYGLTTIDGQTCVKTQWTEKSLRTVATKRGRKRALKRARRQWERGVRQNLGADYAQLKLSRNFNQYCTQHGECFVTAIPCADNWDK